MANQRYEYQVEPVSINPSELNNQTRRINEAIDKYARDGWGLIQTVRIDSSSLLFVFRRPLEVAENDPGDDRG